MPKLKKFLILSMFPVFVLVLSGCGSQTQSSTSPQSPSTNSNSAPANDQSQAQTSDDVATIASQKEAQLPALPTDSKQAIDTAVKSINDDLTTANISTNSSDLSNSSLGL